MSHHWHAARKVEGVPVDVVDVAIWQGLVDAIGASKKDGDFHFAPLKIFVMP